MNSTIIFLSIAIFLLSFMLIFRVQVIFDSRNLTLRLAVYLFFIRIINLKIYLITFKYKFGSRNQENNLKIFITKEEKYLIKQIKMSIFDKLYYDDIYLISNVGLVDASVTANVVGTLNLTESIIREYIKSKSKDTNLYYYNIASFDENKFEVHLEFKVFFTIFDLVFALISSFYKRGRYVRQKIRKQR